MKKLRWYWIYAANVDKAGIVMEGSTPEEAYEKAVKAGFDPQGEEVYAYELGEPHSLGKREVRP